MKRMIQIARWAVLAAILAAFGGNARAAHVGFVTAPAPGVSFAPVFPESLLPESPVSGDIGEAGAFRDGGESLPILPDDPPASDGIWVPILGVILAGLAWRYFQSPAYSALYDRLFGPLSEY